MAVVASVDVERWWTNLHGIWLDWFAICFRRADTRRTAWAYVQGLMSLVEKKNCWWLAQHAGHDRPGSMQRLLGSAAWCPDRLRDVLIRAVAALAASGGVLVVDETGFAKKGVHSAGVARQYSGTLGRIDSCQVGVFVGYTVGRLRVLIDRVLYLPKAWTNDQERCTAAGVPEGTLFAPKPQLALTMIRRIVACGLKPAWVTADEAYGRAGYFRAGLRSLGLAYVVAVACDQQIRQRGQTTRADVLTRRPAGHEWQRYHCGLGSKGPRYFDWAWIAIDGDSPHGQHSLLVRRGSDGGFAYYLTWHPNAATFQDLIMVAGRRWSIEDNFQTEKDQFGLDHYQARGWDGWHRHATLTMLAHALVALAIRDEPTRDFDVKDMTNPDRLIPISIHEVRYLIAALILAVQPARQALLDHLLNWSHWRRQHQTRARAAHYRKRLAIVTC